MKSRRSAFSMVRTACKKGCLVAASTMLVIALAGCASNPSIHEPAFLASLQHKVTDLFDNPNPCSNNARNIGIAAGAAVGALVGHATQKNEKGTLVGAAVGATIGGLIGHSMDQRRCKLYEIAQRNHLKLATARITGTRLGVSGTHTVGLDVQLEDQDVIFEPHSASFVPGAPGYLDQIAAQYSPRELIASLGPNPPHQAVVAAEQRKVLIVTHAAQTRDPLWAKHLSEARARAVALLFAANGVPRWNIYYQGAGDALPIASNATAHGRAANRRVQIVDVPSATDLTRYLQLRTSNPADFAGVTYAQEQQAASSSPSASATTSAEPPAADSHASFFARVSADAKRGAWKAEHAGAAPAPATQAAAPPTAPQLAAALPPGAYDFGGSPLAGVGPAIDLGSLQSHSMFGFVRAAQAREAAVIGSCTTDHPHLAGPVRNLSSGRILPVREDVPGFYGAPWISEPNGNLVAILDAYVPRSAGLPVPDPRVDIYRDYARFHERQPTYSRLAPVNVYRGTNGTLYRVFVGGPMQCMDLFVPTHAGSGPAHIYYPLLGKGYIASSTFNVRQ